MTQERFKNQMELLRLRQQATRIALKLFEAAVCQADLDHVTPLSELCNKSDDIDEIQKAINDLTQLAQAKQIEIDL